MLAHIANARGRGQFLKEGGKDQTAAYYVMRSDKTGGNLGGWGGGGVGGFWGVGGGGGGGVGW